MDIEDFLPDTPEAIDRDAEPKTFSKSLDVNGNRFSNLCCGYIEYSILKKLSVRTL